MSILGICGQFPPEYVTAVVSGQALGGVFTAIIEIVTLTFASDPSASALIFFTIGNVLLVLSLIAYIFMSQSEFFKYYTAEKTHLPKTRLSLQRQPSTREPVFREVLNKMWLYGFTEWLVRSQTIHIVLLVLNFSCYFSGVCRHIVCVPVDYSSHKFAISRQWPSMERRVFPSSNELSDIQFW